MNNPPPRMIQDIEPGDYVKFNGTYHQIASIYGVKEDKRLAKPSEGGFGVFTVHGREITMWEADSYHKAADLKRE